MTVKLIERFHGSVFARIVRSSPEPISFAFVESRDACSYTLDGKIGLYIKYSSKRMRPWQFSFSRSNQEEIAELNRKFGEVFTAFVCNQDGIVFLSFPQLKEVLDHEHGDVEWVRVSRKPRGMYEIKGSDGSLRYRVGESGSLRELLTSAGYVQAVADLAAEE